MTTQPTGRARTRQALVGSSSRTGDGTRTPWRRPPAGLDLLADLHHLTPRDQVIAALLVEHRALTTSQLAAVLFSSVSAARTRLYRLRAKGWVYSFTPIRAAGRLETHWTAGPPAARYVAACDGEPPPTPRAWRQRVEAIAASTLLAHTIGANQVFVDLLAHARAHPGTRLARCWGPVRSAAAAGQRVDPDGHGVWTEQASRGPEGVRQVGFWVEYDTGTEPLHRLVAKIDPYQRYRQIGGADYPVLFVLPNPTRETNLHRLMEHDHDHGSLSATASTTTPQAVAAHGDGMAGQVWQLAGEPGRRRRLIDLPHGPSRFGPYDPGPPTADQDPLHLLLPPGSDPERG